MSNVDEDKSTTMLSVTNTTKGKLPRLPFVAIKDAILGPDYELSIAFISDAKSKTINQRFRKKNAPTNVLSFSFDANSGEILIAPIHARKEAVLFAMTWRKYLLYLLIHGMLHLEGYDHGSTMDRKEKKWKRFFGVTENRTHKK